MPEQFDYITDIPSYEKACASIYGARRLAVDTETCVRKEWLTKGSALDPHTGRISLIIVLRQGSIPKIFDLFHLEAAGYNPQLLIDALESVIDYLLGINFKFDMQFMLGTIDYFPERVRDIMIMGKLISNATGSKVAKGHGHSYQDLCREYLNVHITGKKDLRQSDWGVALSARTLSNDWWARKLLYGADDVKYLFSIYDIMEPAIIAPLPNSPLIQNGNDSDVWGLGMASVLERESAFIPIVAEMEYEGMEVSLETMTLYQEGVSDALNEVGVYLSKELELDTPQKDWSGRDVPSKKALKVLRSSTGLLEVLQKAIRMNRINDVQGKTLKRMLDIIDLLNASKERAAEGGDGESGTEDIFISDDEENLYGELLMMEEAQLIDVSPIVKAILEFKKLHKQEGMDLRKYINPKTGRIHPKYDQLGAATSRACIAGGMRVQVPGGQKKIEDIQVGDYVYCYTEDGRPTLRKVLNTWCHGEQDVVEVKWQSSPNKNVLGRLQCTPNHLFRTKREGWVEAKDLRRYQKVFHLQRGNSQRYDDKSRRPRLYGTNCFIEYEQIVIKKEFFRVPSNWHIHHKDEDPWNNELSNLEVMTRSEHCRLHGLERASKGLIKYEQLHAPENRAAPRYGEDNPGWIEKSKFQLLRMLAKAKGHPAQVDMDFETFKRKCALYNIDIKEVTSRYGKNGTYLSRENVIQALKEGRNTELASKKLGIGTRRLKDVCKKLGVVYSNHSVTSVRPAGKAVVYDLEVEEFNNFICEELCVHNSSSRPNSQQISNKSHVRLTFDKPWFRAPTFGVEVKS